MSTLVTNELFAQPGRGDDVANLLLEILGESLRHDGCETIRIVRDQDDPDHVAGVTQWTERRNFEDYLAWRTERGFSATFEAMLTRLAMTAPLAYRHPQVRLDVDQRDSTSCLMPGVPSPVALAGRIRT